MTVIRMSNGSTIVFRESGHREKWTSANDHREWQRRNGYQDGKEAKLDRAKVKPFTLSPLRWDNQNNGAWYGYSGEFVAAMVVLVKSGPEAGRWSWRVEIDSKWVCPNFGWTRSESISRSAADRAWSIWLQHAGLQMVVS